MKKLIFLAVAITAFIVVSRAQSINTPKLDSFLNALAARGLAMGNLAISKNGVVEYQKPMGYASIDGDKKMPANSHTRYRIGSATKMFTAVMIFQLAEEGKLAINDKLDRYFPTLPNSHTITISHLLYHQSGLHDYTRDTNFPEWMDQPKTQEEMLQIIKDKGADFEPGAQSEYCNSNYLLLGYIIEKAGRLSYGEMLNKRIIAKLELKNTSFATPIREGKNEAASYKYAEGNWNKEKQTNLTIHGGAGSIVSTPADILTFIDALFAGKLVSEASLSKMKTMTNDYGMGMFRDKYGSKPGFGHNGRIEEFYTALWHFPGEKLSIAYCTNGINYPRTDLVEGVLKICFNEPFTLPFRAGSPWETEDLNRYAGKYSAGEIVVNCRKDGNRLVLETRGKQFEVEQISPHYFMHTPTGYFFEFLPGKGELLIKETDNIYYLKKVE